MKVAQYINYTKKRVGNKSFQKEIWDQTWSKNSFEELRNQLFINPIYWRLKDLAKLNDQILEAGCGFGQWVYQLSQEGYDITGVDFAPKTIRKLKKKFKELKFILADVEKLPFEDNSFDVYLSFGVIEHFEDGPQNVLREANRVLKKGGLLFLTIPYLNFFRKIRYSKIKKKGEFYQYLYDEKEFLNHIKKAKFKLAKKCHCDFISAIKKDFPQIYRLINKKAFVGVTNNKAAFSTRVNNSNYLKKPNFILQNILYKLDSYILLIEAHK